MAKILIVDDNPGNRSLLVESSGVVAIRFGRPRMEARHWR
jgi:hypothetical protein